MLNQSYRGGVLPCVSGKSNGNSIKFWLMMTHLNGKILVLDTKVK